MRTYSLIITIAVSFLSLSIWHFVLQRFLHQEALRRLSPLFGSNPHKAKNLIEVRSLLHAIHTATTFPAQPIFHPIQVIARDGSIRKYALSRYPETSPSAENLEQIPDLYSRRVLHAALSGTVLSSQTDSQGTTLEHAPQDSKPLKVRGNNS